MGASLKGKCLKNRDTVGEPSLKIWISGGVVTLDHSLILMERNGLLFGA